MKETILVQKSPFESQVELYRFIWKGTRPRETFSIISGLHGHQLNGLYTTSRLIKFLDAVSEGNEPDYEMRGQIQVFPLLNGRALNTGTRFWTYDDLDLDLAFPGSETGELAEQITHAVFRHSCESDYGVILQTAPDHYEDTPHILCHRPNTTAKKLARSLGLEVMRDLDNAVNLKLKLFYQWLENDVTSVIVSGGKPDTLDLALCESLFEGIVNSLVTTGMLLCSNNSKDKTSVRVFHSGDRFFLTAKYPGMFISNQSVGRRMKQGEHLGELRNIYNGALLQEFVMPEDGILLTLRIHPLVYEKEPVAVCLREKKNLFWPF